MKPKLMCLKRANYQMAIAVAIALQEKTSLCLDHFKHGSYSGSLVHFG